MKINYNFYQDYITLDPNFSNLMKKRISQIHDKYFLDEVHLEDYFVEIFSWSVFPLLILQKLESLIQESNCNTIIDPCAGNAFHTYLFEKFTNLQTLTYDIQDEENSWTPITVKEGVTAIRELESHSNICLLLSWTDYEELSLQLLDSYSGPLVISVGNYEDKSPNYLRKLKENYELVWEIELEMPWSLEEKVEVYRRKCYLNKSYYKSNQYSNT